jgi:hypothetical protein
MFAVGASFGTRSVVLFARSCLVQPSRGAAHRSAAGAGVVRLWGATSLRRMAYGVAQAWRVANLPYILPGHVGVRVARDAKNRTACGAAVRSLS